MFQEIVDDFLLGLLVDSSDIKGDEFKLTPFGPHFREVSVDMLFVPVGECTFSVFSVTSSISTIAFVFPL